MSTVFDLPYLTGITVTFATGNGNRGITRNITLASGESYTFLGPAAIADLKENYDADGSRLPGWVTGGSVTFTPITATDAVDGSAERSANSPKVVSVSIGVVGVDADFNFAAAANTTQQNVNLGAIIPADCFVMAARLKCVSSFGTTETINFEVGTASSGAQLIADAACSDADNLLASAVGASPLVIPSASAVSVWIGGTPSANWSTVTTGKWVLSVIYAPLA